MGWAGAKQEGRETGNAAGSVGISLVTPLGVAQSTALPRGCIPQTV